MQESTEAFLDAMKDITTAELLATKEDRQRLIRAAEEEIAIINQELERRGEHVGNAAVGDNAGQNSC